MKTTTPHSSVCLYGNKCLLILFCLTFTACGSFPKGFRLLKQNEIAKAEKQFQRSEHHRVYGPGARYYLERIKINKNPTTLAWLDIHKTFCDLEEEVNHLAVQQIIKLKRYDAARADIIKSREDLQGRIFEQMSVSGSIKELLALEDKTDCWSDGTLDTLRTIIVNKTIDPSQPVYVLKEGKEWEARPLELPTPEQILTEPGRSCRSLSDAGSYGISYDDATTIAKRYADLVLPSNYGSFWDIQSNIWNIFQVHRSYCDMDQFKADHPTDSFAEDCWFDEAKDTLCLSKLKPLLAFHRNNPHTVLDLSICIQILCLANFAEDANSLDAEERKQVEDVELMLNLHAQLLACELDFSPTAFIDKVAYLAQKYANHQVVFKLAATTLDYFATKNNYDLARAALTTFQPLFTDRSVCHPAFNFQVGKQKWFDLFKTQLDRAEQEKEIPLPAAAWNTPENDEYALVSWGETNEVFFVRRSHETGTAQIMTSKLLDKDWTKATPVKELSIDNSVVPLSISANGRLMLLKRRGKLLRAYRPDIGRPWLEPQAMPMASQFAGNAWLSPDDSLLFMEYYRATPNANYHPQIDIAVAKLTADGSYGNAISIGSQVNLLESDEGNPSMALGGRLFIYTSDQQDGLGRKDIYSVTLTKPNDWSTMSPPFNLGLPLNTIFEDNGLTYFSEYTGLAYFHRLNQCTGDMDIWQVKLGPGVFPKNAMRLAGLVMDENRRPIGGGFMEFTPDYQLNVHAQPISIKGTYTYTVADSTEVVRLFPEIPGYYSERDTTHFLANMVKGEIIQDTFILTSFDYIRRNFKLVHSTFFNGKAEFDNPDKAFPELTRLAKIATRMGAELELSGHTDGTGTEEENYQLSIDRAQSVKQFLVEKGGFDPHRIRVFGFGSSRPICSNDTEDGRRCNRRIEIVFKMPELPSKD